MQMEKVQMSLFKGMCALTGMANKLIEQRPMFQLGKQAASRGY